jgi:hypothetical protein
MRLRVDDPMRAEETLYRLGLVTGIEQGEHGSLELTGERIDDAKAILITRSLVEAGVGVIEIARESESLEQRFLEITSGMPVDADDEDSP